MAKSIDLRLLEFGLYSRYQSLTDAINEVRILGEKLTILEVGGRGSPLARFLPHDSITLSDVFESDAPGYVQADGRNLAFPDRHFDHVVSTEVL